MKTKIFILCSFLAYQCSSLTAQHSTGSGIATFLIPSYNVSVQGYVEFEEGYPGSLPDQPLGRRELNIRTKPHGNSLLECDVTVWVFTLDRRTILGPYSMSCDDILNVGIDDNAWGALVYSEYEILVDVWIGDEGFRPAHDGISKPAATE